MTAPLGFPRRLFVEAYLGERWRDITGDVRQAPALTITQGRKDEAGRTTPCKCTFVLDDGPEHGDGDYNPENAAGAWHGTIGRNTPVRTGLVYGDDQFARTSAGGWGTSPTMGAWSAFLAGTVTSDITAGAARHQITTTSSLLAHYLPSVSIRDVEVYVEANLATATTVAGGTIEIANLMVRGQSITVYYMLRLSITTSQRIEMRLMVGSAQTLAGPIDCGPYNGLASPLSVRFQADGNTFRGKVWETLSGEQVGWNVEYSHGSVYGAGWVGIRSGVAGGNSNTKPISFLYDNFQVRVPRFAGYATKMVPVTELNHVNDRVQVEAAGLLRIVQQGKRTIGTAISRYLATGALNVIDYWPLDEGPDATVQGVNVAPGGILAVFVRETSNPLQPKGAIKWGAATGLPSIGQGPEITQGGMLRMQAQTGRFGTQWSAAWVQKVSADSGGSCWLRTGGEAFQNGDISFVWYTDGSYEVYLVGSPDTLIFSGTFTRYGFDDTWHTIMFSAVRATSTTVTYVLAIDDNQQTGVTAGPVTFTPLYRFEAQAEPTSTEAASYAQVVVFTERIDTLVDDPIGSSFGVTISTVAAVLDSGYRGWIDERAGARFARLCTGQGIPYAMAGYPTVSPPMGPQRDLPLMDLLLECVEVEQGSLFEPKGSPALGLVMLRSMLDKTPALVLDYAAKEVAAPFGPTRDDQGIVNDVTAQRPGGGKYRVQRLTGPLNVNDPGTVAGAVGRYEKPATVNVPTDEALADQAGWRLHMGTVDEARYPTIAVDLASEAFSGQLARTVAALDVGVDDLVHVANAQARYIFETVRQVARGYTETIDTAFLHSLRYNTSPASPYDSFALDDSDARFDSDTSYLASSFNAGVATSMSVTTDGDTRWTTSAGEFPFTVRAGGVVLTVTNITGTGATQTFTVTATPVNGVAKLIPANTPVSLAAPGYLVPGGD